MTESLEAKSRRAAEIFAILKKRFPDARCTLDSGNPFQLLVATILAAQCTDERVNMVTPGLFKRYPDAKALSEAKPAELEKTIKTTGFYRDKTKNLIAMASRLLQEHGGNVPDDMDALTALAGVGRKTANVILGNCFGKPAVIVDTHMKRVATRLRFTKNSNPDKIEADLVQVIPEKDQLHFSHVIVFHGRNICKAPKPLCNECPIIDMCPYPDKPRWAPRPAAGRGPPL